MKIILSVNSFIPTHCRNNKLSMWVHHRQFLSPFIQYLHWDGEGPSSRSFSYLFFLVATSCFPVRRVGAGLRFRVISATSYWRERDFSHLVVTGKEKERLGERSALLSPGDFLGLRYLHLDYTAQAPVCHPSLNLAGLTYKYQDNP